MCQFIRFTCLILLLSGCSTLAPHIRDSNDPFTNMHTRTMWVSVSDSYLLLESLSSYSYVAPRAPANLPTNHIMTVTIGPADTTLTLAKLYPERGFDVPGDARIQLKFKHKDGEGRIINLPLVKGYHTTGGSLIVTARVNGELARALQQEEVDILRIDRVITNEADAEAVDWYPTYEYSRAFRKGAVLLFERQPEPRTKAPKGKAIKTRSDKYF